MSLVNDEPVALTAAVTAFTVAGVGLADVIWELQDAVVSGLNAFIAAGVVLAGAVVRSKVTPV